MKTFKTVPWISLATSPARRLLACAGADHRNWIATTLVLLATSLTRLAVADSWACPEKIEARSEDARFLAESVPAAQGSPPHLTVFQVRGGASGGVGVGVGVVPGTTTSEWHATAAADRPERTAMSFKMRTTR